MSVWNVLALLALGLALGGLLLALFLAVVVFFGPRLGRWP